MTTTVSQFKCPNCGASIPFDSQSQKLKCQHCGNEFDVDNLKAYEAESGILGDDFSWKQDQEEIKDSDKIIYVCPSCGGEVVGDDSMAACSCPYCGNSVIIAKQFEGVLKPDLVIPFKYSKQQAVEALKNFFSGKILLPKNFFNDTVIEKMNGIYMPYWLFDCDSSCSARYRATRMVSYRSGDYQITHTDHYLVYRDGNMSFSNIPVDASLKLSPELLESLEPFDFKDGVDFNTAYLSGYFADKYEEGKDSTIKRANERIKQTTAELMMSTVVGYITVIPESSNIRINEGSIRYALLPIYVIHATHNGKKYTFAMNGQTGKMSGDLPTDNKKFALITIGLFVIVFIIVYLLMRFVVR